MDPSLNSFHLKDVNGVSHYYMVRPHPTSKGQPIVFAILGLLAGPGMEIAEKAIAKASDAEGKEELFEALKDIDLADLGAALSKALKELDPAVLTACFEFTTRDGQPLNQQGNLDSAYEQNWKEYLQALQKIISINGFLPFFSMSTNSEDEVPAPLPPPIPQ